MQLSEYVSRTIHGLVLKEQFQVTNYDFYFTSDFLRLTSHVSLLKSSVSRLTGLSHLLQAQHYSQQYSDPIRQQNHLHSDQSKHILKQNLQHHFQLR